MKAENFYKFKLLVDHNSPALVTQGKQGSGNFAVWRVKGDLKHRVIAHLGMSSGFLPAPKLGPFFLLSLGSELKIRLLY